MRDADPRAILAATVLGSGLAFIDMSGVTVILPVLQEAFNTDLAAVQWVVEAFTLFLAALLLAGGGIGDRFGRRRVFMIGAAIFGAGALAAGLAQSISWLIAARVVQGIGAALLVPGSLSLITAAYPPEKRASAFGVWSAMSGLTAAGSPFLAGFLADSVSWRAVFFLSVPLSLGVIFLLTRVPESHGEDDVPLDVPGVILATLALGGLTFGLVEAGSRGFDDFAVQGALALGVVAFASFIIVELRVAHPMLPLGLFKNRAFAGANGATFFQYAALSGSIFFIPYHLIQVQGWSATKAGAALLPFALLLFLLSRYAGRLADKIGPRLPMTVGAAVTGGGFLVLSFAGKDANYWTEFFPGFILLGVGMSLLIPALTATAMGSVSPRHAGIASGVNNAVARAAGLLAIAFFGLIAVSVFTANLTPAEIAAYGPDGARFGAIVPDGVSVDSAQDAFIAAYRVVMLASGGFSLAAAAIAYVTTPKRLDAALAPSG